MKEKQYIIKQNINILDIKNAFIFLEDLGLSREKKIKSLIKQQDYLIIIKNTISSLINLEKDAKQKKLLTKLQNDFEYIEENYKLEPKITTK